jgi:biotin-(acetyl-CoA carboxylase) ligase
MFCRVGTLVIPSIQSRVSSGALTALKWPNDVLIGEEKVCGVLIEVEGDFMLIGIGCNIMTAPPVETTGLNNGRQSTCLARHITSCGSSDADADVQIEILTDTCPSLGELHKEIAAEIYGALSTLILQPKETAEQVVVDFERYMNFAPQRLRGDTDAGDTVTPLKVNKDGTLQVIADLCVEFSPNFIYPPTASLSLSS